jgi:hypothetical protein
MSIRMPERYNVPATAWWQKSLLSFYIFFPPGLLKGLAYTSDVLYPCNYIAYVQFNTNFLHNASYIYIYFFY